MELIKQHIHMNRRRGSVTSQMTLDDDFNVPDSMDDVEQLFAEMEIYAKTEEKPHFAACCRQLGVMLRSKTVHSSCHSSRKIWSFLLSRWLLSPEMS